MTLNAGSFKEGQLVGSRGSVAQKAARVEKAKKQRPWLNNNKLVCSDQSLGATLKPNEAFTVAFDTPSFYAVLAKVDDASVYIKYDQDKGSYFLGVDCDNLVNDAANLFLNKYVQPVRNQLQKLDRSGLGDKGVIYLDGDTTGLKYTSSQVRDKQSFRTFLRAIAECEVLEDFGTAQKHLYSLLLPSLVASVADKVVDLCRSNTDFPLSIFQCTEEEADVEIHKAHLNGSISVVVTTDQDIYLARCVPRLVYEVKELKVKNFQPNAFLSLTRLVKSDIASFRGIGVVTLRDTLCSFDLEESKVLSSEWLEKRQVLVSAWDAKRQPTKEEQKPFIASSLKIVDFLLEHLDGEGKYQVDWALNDKSPKSDRPITLRSALVTAFLYDHLPLLGENYQELDEVKQILVLKRKPIQRSRALLDERDGQNLGIQRLYLPPRNLPQVNNFVTFLEQDEAGVELEFKNVQQKIRHLGVKIARQSNFQAQFEAPLKKLFEESLHLHKGKEGLEGAVSTSTSASASASASARASASASASANLAKFTQLPVAKSHLAELNAKNYDKDSDEYRSTKEAVENAEDPIFAGTKFFEPPSDRFYTSGIFQQFSHGLQGWQGRDEKGKTPKIEQGSALPFQKTDPLVPLFQEMTVFVRDISQLVRIWFGQAAFEEFEQLSNRFKGKVGSPAQKVAFRDAFRKHLEAWKAAQAIELTKHKQYQEWFQEAPEERKFFLDRYCERASQRFQELLSFYRPTKLTESFGVARHIFFITGRTATIECDSRKPDFSAPEVDVDTDILDIAIEAAKLERAQDESLSRHEEGHGAQEGDELKSPYSTAIFKTSFDAIKDQGTADVLRNVSQHGLHPIASHITKAVGAELFETKGSELTSRQEEKTVQLTIQSEIARAGGFSKVFPTITSLTNPTIAIGTKAQSSDEWRQEWIESINAQACDFLKYNTRKKRKGLAYREACFWETDQNTLVLARYLGKTSAGETLLAIVPNENEFFSQGMIAKESIKSDKTTEKKMSLKAPRLHKANIQVAIETGKGALAGNRFMPSNTDLAPGCSPSMSQKVRAQRLGNLASQINHVLFGLASHSKFGRVPTLRAIPLSSRVHPGHSATTVHHNREGAVCIENGEATEFEHEKVLAGIMEGKNVYIQLGSHIQHARKDVLGGYTDSQWKHMFSSRPRTRSSSSTPRLAQARIRVLLNSCERAVFLECLREDMGCSVLHHRFKLVPGRRGKFELHALHFPDIKSCSFKLPTTIGEKTPSFRYACADPGASNQTVATDGTIVVALADLFEKGGIEELVLQRQEAQSRVVRLHAAISPNSPAPNLNPGNSKRCGTASQQKKTAEEKRKRKREIENFYHLVWPDPHSKDGDRVLQEWVAMVGQKKAYRKLNIWRRRHLDLTRRIRKKLQGHFRQYAASIAKNPSTDVVFLPKLSLKNIKATRAGTRRVRQLVQHLSLAQLDDAIHRACYREGKRVIRSKEWATTLKEAFAVREHFENGITVELYKANRIGPNKYQRSPGGALFPRDALAACHSMKASFETSKGYSDELKHGLQTTASQ